MPINLHIMYVWYLYFNVPFLGITNDSQTQQNVQPHIGKQIMYIKAKNYNHHF